MGNVTLRTLNYRIYGRFRILGHAGFISSAVGSHPEPQERPWSQNPEPQKHTQLKEATSGEFGVFRASIRLLIRYIDLL